MHTLNLLKDELARWTHCGCIGVDDDDADAVHTFPFSQDDDD